MTRRTALGCLASAALVRAQSKQDRGRSLLQDTLQALGGERFLAVQDRIESGRAYSFYRERLTGLARATIYTRYLTPSDKPEPGRIYQRERQAFGKDEDYAILFDEEKGYSITFRGATPLPEATLTRYRDTTRRNFFYFLRQRRNEPGLLLEHQGSQVFQNQPVEVLDITDDENVTLTVMIHQSTRLPVRQVFYRRDPATKERREEVTFFSKYRDVGGGVQWPWAMTRFRDNEKIFELFSDAVTINQGLSDQLFTLPANMKVLPPPR
ncbi:MAG: hypothetical protein JNN08_16250 [Bryobacterales bacterium]|nr:hypothetical protein [Bryobacterales bacterium]